MLPTAPVPQEDVRRVYAPGKLYFLYRHDPPAAGADTTPADEAATVAASAGKAAASAATGSSPIADDATATAAAAGSEEHIQPVHDTVENQKQDGKEVEKEQPYPGATFELIEGEPGEMFKRIVLRDSCLKDHLCGGYVQGLEYVVSKLEAADKEE